MTTLETTLVAHVEAILGPDGIMTRAVGTNGKRFSHNEAQLEYARLSARGFCRKDSHAQRTAINILQAATGTGKSIGYLVPLMVYAALTGERVAVSTFTRHLQQQLLEDAELVNGWVRQVTGRSLQIARRIGQANYVSAVAIARLQDAAATDDRLDLEFLEQLQEWVEAEDRKGHRLNSGILNDFLDEHGFDGLPAGMSAASIRLTAEDPPEELARYEADIVASKKADLLIVNHALSMVNAMRWGAMLDDERQISVMVFDEADRLHQAAESTMNADVTLFSALSLCNDLATETGIAAPAEAMRALYDKVKTIKPPHDNVLALASTSAVMRDVRQLLAETTQALRPVAKKLAALESGSRLKGLGSLSKEACADIMDLMIDLDSVTRAVEADNENVAVACWSPVRAYPSLRLGKADPGRLLARMWAMVADPDDALLPPTPYLSSVLFTSATIGTPGRRMPDMFADFMSSVGILHIPRHGETEPRHFIQTDLFRSFEPTSFGTMKFVLADPRVAGPFMRMDEDTDNIALTEEWVEYCATMVRAAHAAGGRTLVLANSYVDCELLKDRLQDIADDLLVHERGNSLSQYLEPFRNSRTGVLISPAAWEGIDLPSVISHIVVTRIPNKRPDSIDLLLFGMALQKRGMAKDKINGMIMGRIYTDAQRRLAQGFGRGIRRASDKVTIWIADPRFPLPDTIAGSLDPIVMEAVPRKAMNTMAMSIPTRFRSRAYPKAQLLTMEGKLYTPEV